MENEKKTTPIITEKFPGAIDVRRAFELAICLESIMNEYTETGFPNLVNVFPAKEDMTKLKKTARMLEGVCAWFEACTEYAVTEEREIYGVQAYPNSKPFVTMDYNEALQEAERKNKELDVTWVTPGIRNNVTLYYPE